jgi:hypothetical protein
MDLDLSKIFKIMSLLGILTACQKLPEEHFMSLLKNNYANLYINDQSHKRAVLSKLEDYLKTHSLNSENEKEISLILNEINDGHVLLKNNKSLKKEKHSDLEFIPGTMVISQCLKTCKPKIDLGKYEILRVNQTPFEDWLKENSGHVYASTPWGRKFRTSRLLVSNKLSNEYSLSIKNAEGLQSEVVVSNELINTPIEKCIEGKRIDDNTFYVKIKTLWCDKKDDELFKNYREDWSEVTSSIKKSDKIIIDLRENNGGDDAEVIYSLNSFIKGEYPVYQSQYLTINEPGKLKKIIHLLPLKFNLWGKKSVDKSDQGHKAEKTFYDNKINVLISNGCFSSCEGLAAAFKNLNRAKLFGTVTHGGAGDPRFFPISGSDYSINLPIGLSYQSNGELIEGKGISPHFEVIDSLKISGDAVLERALKD